MAQQGVFFDKDQFSCSICLDLVKDPVFVPCGHSYCRVCIESSWDQDERRVCICPQCRESFSPRPALRRNYMLAQLAEKFTVATEKTRELPADPKTRADFLQYACQLSLDPNTAHKYLSLSEDRKATWIEQEDRYPDHPDRFITYDQVLCREALSGRCYWEVGWTGDGVDVAVSYKDIGRTRWASRFGNNDKSWRLDYSSSNGYIYCHNGTVIQLSVASPVTSRLGVFLDHQAGSLSFFSVSDTLTLLYRVKTKPFTKPLYPGFGVDYGSIVEISKLW